MHSHCVLNMDSRYCKAVMPHHSQVWAFYMEVTGTSLSCNSSEPHHIIHPGASSGLAAILPCCSATGAPTICTLGGRWCIWGAGPSKGRLDHLNTCLKKKFRKQKRKRKPFGHWRTFIHHQSQFFCFFTTSQFFNMKENIIQKGKPHIFPYFSPSS